MSKKILIVYTGGTFGMRRTSEGYAVDAGLSELLDRVLSAVPTELPDYQLLELEELLDSSCMVPADWYRIARVILDHYDAFDGFIILHGTDTMAYTASALSFILQGLDKPIIVTGSQIPLRELRSDAYSNLLASLVLIEHYTIAEVGLFFNGKLLRGNRATKVSAGSLDAFESPNHPLLAEVGIDVHINEHALLDPPVARNFSLPAGEGVDLVLLKLFPGMPARYLAGVLASGPQGIVLETFGTGNAPTSHPAFRSLLEQAQQRDVVVVAVSQCAHSRVDFAKYAAGSGLAATGVVAGLDMTTEAAFAKLQHLLASGLSPQKVRQQMSQALCGELTHS